MSDIASGSVGPAAQGRRRGGRSCRIGLTTALPPILRRLARSAPPVERSSGPAAEILAAADRIAALGNGNAEIREVLSGIPSPCYAPVVFVTSAGGSWFATSGG